MHGDFFEGSEGRVFYRRWDVTGSARRERSRQAVEEMPTRDRTIHVYQGARHEVFNETNRAEVVGHLADWLDRITAR